MLNEGDRSEDPTQVFRREWEPIPGLEEAFEEEGGRTVLESPASIAARACASFAIPEQAVQRAQLPLRRRLTLTPLPGANPSSVALPPLAPITRHAPLVPPRARRPEMARYRLLGVVALTGLVLGMALFRLAHAIL